jgi:outer membrane biosynthesis protein TonB
VTCDPGSPSTFQLFETVGVTVRGNTFAQNAGGETFRERSNSGIAFDHNVVYGFGPYDDQGPDFADYYRQASVMTEDHNVGAFSWTWPLAYRGSHDVATSSPAFRAPAQGDYRLAAPVAGGGQTYTAGVSWAVGDKQFGRGSSSAPPVEPAPPVETPPVMTPPVTTPAPGPVVTTPPAAPKAEPKPKAKPKRSTRRDRHRAAARRAAKARAKARRAQARASSPRSSRGAP